MASSDFVKSLIFLTGFIFVCFGESAEQNVMVSALLSDDNSTANGSTSTSVLSTSVNPVKGTTPKDALHKISKATWALIAITLIYWFITLIVSFVLCIKYMGSQKRRALPHPPPEVKLSEREYEEFSEVPNEAGNSRIQGFKNKIGRVVKRSDKKESSQQQEDEFAM